MRFSDLKVGDRFTIDGEIFKKTGVSTYVSIENPILGEYSIQPYTEGRMKPLVEEPSVKKPVEKATTKKVRVTRKKK